MKKFTYFAAIAAFAGILFASCNKQINAPVAVTGISLDKPTISLEIGDTAQLTATVFPNDAADKSVSWTSSDNSVATVADGKVTAVAVGEATITVTTADGGKTATCFVTVIVPISAQSISLDKTEHTLLVGDDFTLTATVLPANSTDNVEWQTSNAAVAAVSNGLITAIAVGNATITAKAGDKTATCLITVTEPDPFTDEGVIINGVKWATRNIAAPGHFADTPESAGMFYQWNRKIGWSSTNPMTNFNGGTTWNHTDATGTEWSAGNGLARSNTCATSNFG